MSKSICHVIGKLTTDKNCIATDFNDFDGAKHLRWSYFGGLAKFMALTGDNHRSGACWQSRLMDEQGNVVIPPIYDDAHAFEYTNIGAVKQGDK